MRNCFLIFCFFLFACTKYRPAKKPTTVFDDPENLSALLTGQWKLYEEASSPANDWNGDGTEETDMFSTYDSCKREGGFSFQTTGRGRIYKTCADSNTVVWKIINESNDFVLTIEANGSTIDEKNYRIIQLNQNIFIITTSILLPNGKRFQVTSRYFKR